MAGVSHSVERTIVLVHGAFVDGSGWESVYRILKKDGYRVTIVQNPTISLADDVAATKRIIHAQNGPVILVGHSYGGAVITEAGNDPQVVGLVYIAAFAPDTGESVSTLLKDTPPGAPASPILPPQDGYLYQDKVRFPASFAADVDEEKAVFMADSQVPWGEEALNGMISEPAWRTKPSWYLIATDDKMIPLSAQRFMSRRAGSTVVEGAGSHAIYMSQPGAVAELIEQAVQGVKVSANAAIVIWLESVFRGSSAFIMQKYFRPLSQQKAGTLNGPVKTPQHKKHLIAQSVDIYHPCRMTSPETL